jgi:hypothetical protein
MSTRRLDPLLELSARAARDLSRAFFEVASAQAPTAPLVRFVRANPASHLTLTK